MRRRTVLHQIKEDVGGKMSGRKGCIGGTSRMGRWVSEKTRGAEMGFLAPVPEGYAGEGTDCLVSGTWGGGVWERQGEGNGKSRGQEGVT